MTATAPVQQSTESLMRALLEAGVHFGHQTKRWNPKMAPFIFGDRDGIHIVDLHQTALLLQEARDAITEIAASGGKVVYVGTKKQAQEVVATEAGRCGMYFVNRRWLGGTLTNFRTIRSRLQYLRRLEQQHAAGAFEVLPRQEAISREHELEKLERNLGGLKTLNQLPSAIIVVDPRREVLAVKEASRLGIPIFAITDTNCDPDPIDYIIPGNDDAIRSIRLLVSHLTDGIIDGLTRMESVFADEGDEEVPGDIPGAMAEALADSEAEVPDDADESEKSAE